VFIYALFNDAVSVALCMVSNVGQVGNVEGSGSGPLSWHLPVDTEVHY
jgi:hypothetical protein